MANKTYTTNGPSFMEMMKRPPTDINFHNGEKESLTTIVSKTKKDTSKPLMVKCDNGDSVDLRKIFK